ncbi:hypothetical protein JYU34_005465 [Plutella xylostella]|uniref:Uncharacterized protein n=1 Tax=Plutella xylostella TaxID=51655 RepID=A0ABQ7QWV6_PLUXY|nr:hypothetical protein JYU34_005465 [Plutella xylostella]
MNEAHDDDDDDIADNRNTRQCTRINLKNSLLIISPLKNLVTKKRTRIPHISRPVPSRVRPWNVVHARSRTVGAISHPVRGPALDRHSFVSRASVLYGSAHRSCTQ